MARTGWRRDRPRSGSDRCPALPERARPSRGASSSATPGGRAIGLALFLLLASGCGATLGQELFVARARLVPADAIVVLGNRPPRGPDGAVAPETGRRVRRGVELYEQGLAPVLVVAGGPAPGGGTEAAVMAEYARALGVPADAIRVEDRSRDTTENAGNTLRLLCAGRRRCRPSLIVVSTPYHLRRARWLFRCAGARVQPAPAALPDDYLTRVGYTAHEYAATLASYAADACGRARAIASGR